jgi:hypothetical protein
MVTDTRRVQAGEWMTSDGGWHRQTRLTVLFR